MDIGSTGKAVPSVDRALNLLELLASASAGMTLTAISRKLAIPKSSAYYLVTTLAKRNFVRRKAGQHVYFIGTNTTPFVTNTDAESDLKQLCSPFIQAVSRKLVMVAQIGIRDGSEVRIIERSEIPGLRLDSWVGRHFDLHCTAVGKALISHLAGPEVESLFRTRGLPRHNQHTLCSMDLLKAQLIRTRQLGFSTDNEEHELGVRCVASPILNHLGGVVAAVCIFAPASRLAPGDMPNVGAELVKAAREISRVLADHPVGKFERVPSSAVTQTIPRK
jgi:IclR family KDG regulon transcriptional repressor